MSIKSTTARLGAIMTGAFLLGSTAANALVIEHITNGGFETGTFAGWTSTNSGPPGAWTINNGAFDPQGPGGVLAPISGIFDAVGHQTGPSLQTLAQQAVLLPQSIINAKLSWMDRLRNYAGVFIDPTQEWRVLIETTDGALIHEVFSTNPGDPLQQIGPNMRMFDLTTVLQPLAGQTIVVSFELQADIFFLNATLDDVSFTTTIPEPGTLALFGLGLAGLGFARRKRAA